MEPSRRSELTASDRLALHQSSDCHPLQDLAQDAREGLLQAPRSLPPKYFYDERGSQLFDAICETREYYPTRTENALLDRYSLNIVEATNPRSIVEFGSGTARKTRHLLQAAAHLDLSPTYWPFDICESMVRESGEALVKKYPWLTVRGMVGDYLAGLERLPLPDGPVLYVFLGGTIGNFTHDEAVAFLEEVRSCMRPQDSLLLGADRVKDRHVLHAAYNDAAGLTAEFNLNLLQVLNRELQADFDLESFQHQACYNETEHQIEMYLVSLRDQHVHLAGLGADFYMERGERILTEISRKFSLETLARLLRDSGLLLERHYQPDNGWFSLALARPASGD